MNSQVFFGHFDVDTYSLCSMVRDVQQDMLKGPLSANRLNTHITHTSSFLISLLCVLSFITVMAQTPGHRPAPC